MKVFNPTLSPLVIDGEGRILGGNEHLEIKGDPSPEILKHIENEDLLIVEEPTVESSRPSDDSGDTMLEDKKPTRTQTRSTQKKG